MINNKIIKGILIPNKNNRKPYSKNSKYILYITPGSLITSIIAYNRNQYTLSYAELSIFISSILHWYKPRYGYGIIILV